jgi:3',5'-cyclic AMP phosphodiesterase CpdA
MSDITFVHLTDTHILDNPGDNTYGIDTAASFRQVIAEIEALKVEPAFVLLTGDLANHGTEAAYNHLKSLIEETIQGWNVPYFMNLGNHDTRTTFRKVFLNDESVAEEAPHYTRDMVGDVRVIMLDSKVVGGIHGHLDQVQLEWLDKQLATPAPAGTVIGLHHPPVNRGIPRKGEEMLLLDNGDALAEVIEGRDVLGILSGHTHVPASSIFAGSLISIGAATAFLGAVSTRDGGATLTGAGFNICSIRGERLITNSYILPGDREVRHSYSSADLERHVLAAAG